MSTFFTDDEDIGKAIDESEESMDVDIKESNDIKEKTQFPKFFFTAHDPRLKADAAGELFTFS